MPSHAQRSRNSPRPRTPAAPATAPAAVPAAAAAHTNFLVQDGRDDAALFDVVATGHDDGWTTAFAGSRTLAPIAENVSAISGSVTSLPGHASDLDVPLTLSQQQPLPPRQLSPVINSNSVSTGTVSSGASPRAQRVSLRALPATISNSSLSPSPSSQPTSNNALPSLSRRMWNQFPPRELGNSSPPQPPLQYHRDREPGSAGGAGEADEHRTGQPTHASGLDPPRGSGSNSGGGGATPVHVVNPQLAQLLGQSTRCGDSAPCLALPLSAPLSSLTTSIPRRVPQPVDHDRRDWTGHKQNDAWVKSPTRDAPLPAPRLSISSTSGGGFASLLPPGHDPSSASPRTVSPATPGHRSASKAARRNSSHYQSNITATTPSFMSAATPNRKPDLPFPLAMASFTPPANATWPRRHTFSLSKPPSPQKEAGVRRTGRSPTSHALAELQLFPDFLNTSPNRLEKLPSARDGEGSWPGDESAEVRTPSLQRHGGGRRQSSAATPELEKLHEAAVAAAAAPPTPPELRGTLQRLERDLRGRGASSPPLTSPMHRPQSRSSSLATDRSGLPGPMTPPPALASVPRSNGDEGGQSLGAPRHLVLSHAQLTPPLPSALPTRSRPVVKGTMADLTIPRSTLSSQELLSAAASTPSELRASTEQLTSAYSASRAPLSADVQALPEQQHHYYNNHQHQQQASGRASTPLRDQLGHAHSVVSTQERTFVSRQLSTRGRRHGSAPNASVYTNSSLSASRRSSYSPLPPTSLHSGAEVSAILRNAAAVTPEPPWSPTEALYWMRDRLTLQEQEEMQTYDLIYYCGPPLQPRTACGVTDRATPLPSTHSWPTTLGERTSTASTSESTPRPRVQQSGSDATVMSLLPADAPPSYFPIAIGMQIAFRYEVVEVLGFGTFSVVVRAVDHAAAPQSPERYCALKLIRREELYQHAAQAEWNVCEQLKECCSAMRHLSVGSVDETISDLRPESSSAWSGSRPAASSSTPTPASPSPWLSALDQKTLRFASVLTPRGRLDYRGYHVIIFPLLGFSVRDVMELRRESREGKALDQLGSVSLVTTPAGAPLSSIGRSSAGGERAAAAAAAAAAATLPQEVTTSILAQLARALYFMHNGAHILHGDIKPENVVFVDRAVGAGTTNGGGGGGGGAGVAAEWAAASMTGAAGAPTPTAQHATAASRTHSYQNRPSSHTPSQPLCSTTLTPVPSVAAMSTTALGDSTGLVTPLIMQAFRRPSFGVPAPAFCTAAAAAAHPTLATHAPRRPQSLDHAYERRTSADGAERGSVSSSTSACSSSLPWLTTPHPPQRDADAVAGGPGASGLYENGNGGGERGAPATPLPLSAERSPQRPALHHHTSSAAADASGGPRRHSSAADVQDPHSGGSGPSGGCLTSAAAAVSLTLRSPGMTGSHTSGFTASPASTTANDTVVLDVGLPRGTTSSSSGHGVNFGGRGGDAGDDGASLHNAAAPSPAAPLSAPRVRLAYSLPQAMSAACSSASGFVPTTSRVALIDLGHAHLIPPGTTGTSFPLQSPSYRCPEMALRLPYTTAIDMWSVGCVLYEFHTGRVLFSEACDDTTLLRVAVRVLGMPDAAFLSAVKMCWRQYKQHKASLVSSTLRWLPGEDGSGQGTASPRPRPQLGARDPHAGPSAGPSASSDVDDEAAVVEQCWRDFISVLNTAAGQQRESEKRLKRSRRVTSSPPTADTSSSGSTGGGKSATTVVATTTWETPEQLALLQLLFPTGDVDTAEQLFSVVREDPVSAAAVPQYAWADFMLGCLFWDAEERLTAAEARVHPYLAALFTPEYATPTGSSSLLERNDDNNVLAASVSSPLLSNSPVTAESTVRPTHCSGLYYLRCHPLTASLMRPRARGASNAASMSLSAHGHTSATDVVAPPPPPGMAFGSLLLASSSIVPFELPSSNTIAPSARVWEEHQLRLAQEMQVQHIHHHRVQHGQHLPQPSFQHLALCYDATLDFHSVLHTPADRASLSHAEHSSRRGNPFDSLNGASVRQTNVSESELGMDSVAAVSMVSSTRGYLGSTQAPGSDLTTSEVMVLPLN